MVYLFAENFGPEPEKDGPPLKILVRGRPNCFN